MLKAWFSRFRRRDDAPIHVDEAPSMIDRVRLAVDEVQRSSDEVQKRIKPYQEADNPLFAILSRVINRQAINDDSEPHP